MQPLISVFDPTIKDPQSKVRGIGRYLQILRENFSDEFVFTNNLSSIIYHPSSIFIHPFFNFLQQPLTMKRVAQKQVAVIHDLIPLKYPDHFPAGIRGRFNIFLNKFALRNYDIIITDSEASKKDIVDMLKVESRKVKVVYPCLLKIFTKESPKSKVQSPKSRYCLYVGDATWNKNLVSLARAVKIVNVTCLFIGKVFSELTSLRVTNPWQKELQEFLREIKDDKRFIFLGFVDDYRLINLYERSRCNILVSRDEGFGFSFVEAARFGTPSVLSDIPVFREIAQDGALFCDFNDPHDIADAVGKLYFKDKTRSEIGFKAQQKSNYFSQEQFKRDFLQAINS